MLALLGVPVDAAYHLVFALTSILTPVLGGLAAAAGIIVFTAAIRLLVMPLSFRALRGQAAQARLAPQVQKLRQRYGRRPERLQRELTALYRREGTSVFAGFAPLLAQAPVFSVLYLLFRSPNVAGGPNRLLSHDLFGVPLGNHWLTGFSALSGQDGVFLGVFAILAVICWLSVRMARRMSAVVSPQTAKRVATRRELTIRSGSVPTDRNGVRFPPIRRLGPADLGGCVALSVDRGWSPEQAKWSLLLELAEAFGIDAPD